MRKLLLLTASIILLLTSCTHNKQSNLAVIHGKIHYKSNEVKFKWFKEHTADINTKTYIAAIDSSGEFEVKIPIQQLSKGTMVINNQNYDLVLIPNDKITMSISKDSVIYSGKGAEKNNFLYKLSQNKKCSKMDIIMSWYRDEHKLSDFYLMIDKYTNARKSEFEKYISSHTLEKEFIDYYNIETKLENISLYQNAVTVYSRKNRIPLDSIEIPSEFKKQYSIQELVNDKYLLYSNYMSILNNQMASTIEKIMAKNSSVKRDSVRLSVVMDSLSGKTREHYLVKDIYYNLSIYDQYNASTIAAFNSIKSDKNCINTVESVLTKYNNKKAMIGAPLDVECGKTVLLDTLNHETTINKVLSESKGKVIYLDIWSLGCGPCRKAMSFSKKLKEKLKDYPIEFIYITVDNYSDKLWDEVFKVTQTHNNHYRFAKGFDSRLHNLWNIMSVPTYILIDKEGKLVSYKAERPFNNRWEENSKLEKILIDLAS